MKNNKSLKIIFSILIGLLIASSTSFAAYNEILAKETTDAYKKWQTLSEEEKQNYIEPAPYSLDIDDSVRMSVYQKFTRGIGLSPIESAYYLNNDIQIKVKDQESTNECWAFATTTALETNVAKTRNQTIELSPRHIDYATSRTFLDGINSKGYNREIGYGNYYISLAYCTSGNGPVLEEDMPFENNENKINLSEIDIDPVLKLEDYLQYANIFKQYSEDGTMIYTNGSGIEYTESQAIGVRNLIKNHIKQYGAVMGYTYLGGNLVERLNIEKINAGLANSVAYYNSDSNSSYDHGIAIIGWDDNYSKENFNENNKPKNDGAYLVLNSSGATNGILSLMYISYEDVWIEYGNYGIVSTSDIDYDNIYQYDEYGFNLYIPLTNSATGQPVNTGYAANVFKRQETTKEEYLNEVSVYVPSTSNIDIYVNTANNDKTKITKVASAGILEPGYHTVKLSTPLKLTGSNFVVAAKFTSNAVNIPVEVSTLSNGGQSNFWDNATSEAGQSFISLDGNTWDDVYDSLKDCNVCIKAFTTYQEVSTEVNVTGVTLNKTKAEMEEGESLTLVATITPSDATNKNVTWTSSNKEVATITNTGIITAIKEGTTNITVTTEDGNKTATCTITVKGKVSEDDDIYYQDQDQVTQDTDNLGSNFDNKEKDTTTATGSIPQTGETIFTIAVIIITTISVVIIYIKIRKMNDII